VAPQTYDVDEWQRHGRGRELQFFATDDEVRDYLKSLPPEFGPYDLVGSRLVSKGRAYEPEPYVVSIDDFIDNLGESAVSQAWVRPAAILPAISLEKVAVDAWCSVNGLVLLQHGGWRRERKREASRIAVVDRIVNARSGAVVGLVRQAAVFDALKKRIKRDLKFTSVHTFRDGHEEESSLQLMTAAAADLARRGYFEARPGGPWQGRLGRKRREKSP
jgi:hypothetical protein